MLKKWLTIKIIERPKQIKPEQDKKLKFLFETLFQELKEEIFKCLALTSYGEFILDVWKMKNTNISHKDK